MSVSQTSKPSKTAAKKAASKSAKSTKAPAAALGKKTALADAIAAALKPAASFGDGICNVDSHTLFNGDNLPVLRGMNSACVDLVYLDPPFNKNKDFVGATADSKADAEIHFRDIYTRDDIKDDWVKSIANDHPRLHAYLTALEICAQESTYCYCVYMAIRLIEIHRVIKSAGACYLHCDSTESPRLRQLMDIIFGQKNYVSEIIWKRFAGRKNSATRKLSQDSDSILFYVKSDKHFVNIPRQPLMESSLAQYKNDDNDGMGPYRMRPLHDRHTQNHFDYKGYKCPPKGWMKSLARMQELDENGELHFPKNKNHQIQQKCFLTQVRGKAGRLVESYSKGANVGSVWLDIPHAQGNERTEYRTLKPLALMERILKMSSKEGDMVLDPFCGCATTCVAAHFMGRRWIGIDHNPRAPAWIIDRMRDGRDRFETLPGLAPGDPEITHRNTAPKRTDIDGEGPMGFLYIVKDDDPTNIGRKVGITTNPSNRLQGLDGVKSRHAPKHSYVRLYATRAAAKLEAHIHRAFCPRGKPNGEWIYAERVHAFDPEKLTAELCDAIEEWLNKNDPMWQPVPVEEVNRALGL